MNIISIFVIGFILGLEHALEPDHLIAVSILVSERKGIRASAFLGMAWGMGHTSILLIVGTIILITKITIPVKLALSLEFLVGLMIIFLGINALRKAIRGKSLHSHTHHHSDGDTHTHLHSHHQTQQHSHGHHLRQSFLIGLVHGGAGSAALALLVLTTVDSLLSGILYILIFGVGSIVGMLLVGMLMAMPLQVVVNSARWNRLPGFLTGILGLVIGSTIVFNITVVQHLFG